MNVEMSLNRPLVSAEKAGNQGGNQGVSGQDENMEGQSIFQALMVKTMTKNQDQTSEGLFTQGFILDKLSFQGKEFILENDILDKDDGTSALMLGSGILNFIPVQSLGSVIKAGEEFAVNALGNKENFSKTEIGSNQDFIASMETGLNFDKGLGSQMGIGLNQTSDPDVKAKGNEDLAKAATAPVSKSENLSYGQGETGKSIWTTANQNPSLKNESVEASGEKVADVNLQDSKTEFSSKLKDLREGNMNYQGLAQNEGLRSETTLGNTQSQAVEKLEPYSQIGEEVMAKLEKKGPMEFKMQLQPKDLGLIDIKLRINEGKLTIDIMAATAKTQSLLTSQVDRLIMSMGLQNFQIETVKVGLDQQQNQSGFNNDQGFAQNLGMGFSQRRQQEQLINQNANGNNPVENNEDGLELAKDIKNLGTNRRMDYAV